MASSTEESTDDPDVSTTESSVDQVPEWILAKKGIDLLLNNNSKEAEDLFTKYPNSLPMFAGYSFACFMDALMTFEDDKLNLATTILKEVERKCSAQAGWLRSVKKVFGNQSETSSTLAQDLEAQIILADSQVCLAILTFLQQEISGFLKGGWVLRKAWKVYQATYQDIFRLYKEIIGRSPLPGTRRVSFLHNHGSSSGSSMDSEDPPDFSPPNGKNQKVDKATIRRLMGAISFGYGLFQLGVSLLPPSLLKLTNFLGFGGNRQNGVDCLMYARKGVDMRAPLATLVLLWYHTIVRPFYALDGSNVRAGSEAAQQLIDESEAQYGGSALFLFFKGRVSRLKSDILLALRSFQAAVDNATQREIKILALHEVGWCYLIQLDYCNAESTFSYLKSRSRWSRAFYTYLAGICTGSCADNTEIANIRAISVSILRDNKMNQMDAFLHRRVKRCPSDDESISKVDSMFWRILVYEMLYLWNALPSCTPEKVQEIKNDCCSLIESGSAEPMLGLSNLILGACYCVEKQYLNGIESFKECLNKRKETANNADDAHISAFCHYELGSLLIQTEETKDEGKYQLQRVGAYKDYDFEHRLNVRVHTLLKQL